MGVYHNWLSIVWKKFRKSRPQRTIILVDHIDDKISFGEQLYEEQLLNGEYKVGDNDKLSFNKKGLSQENMATIKIQSFFRSYLARKAFRALKSLVKLQALVRGVQVRRQSRIALHCMHALVRLQVTIRARQLLSSA